MTIDDNSRAATFLRTLAAVEHADAVGDSREVGRLLAGVDPVEVRWLADALDFQAARARLSVRDSESLHRAGSSSLDDAAEGLVMDPAEARRQRELVDGLRRLEDEVRRQGNTLDTVLGTLELIRGRLDDEGGAGVREPREPAPVAVHA